MKSIISALTIDISSMIMSSTSLISLQCSLLYFRVSLILPPMNLGSSGTKGWKGSLKKLCIVLPPALMAAIPVGASTTYFFFVFLQTYLRKVDFPVPAFPVRNKDDEVNCTKFRAFWNCMLSLSMVFSSMSVLISAEPLYFLVFLLSPFCPCRTSGFLHHA